MTDAAIPAECESAGDFETSYSVHRRSVYATALHIVGNHFAAEDVTQQVFLNLWLRPAAFRGGNLRAWLGRCARNKAIGLLRRDVSIPIDSIIAQNALRAPHAYRPVEDQVMQSMTSEVVQRAIAALKPREQPLIIASFLEEQSHHQIARGSRLPLGTVKTRIRAGLRRMRPRMVAIL